MNKKYKSLAKNTSIFAMGTFGSKVLTFLIVPLYTHVLTTAEYGVIDLFSASISLLVPFTTLLIYEAAIRFLVAKEYDEKTVFNNCFLVFAGGSILTICLSPFLLSGLNMKEYSFIFVLLLILTSYTAIFGQYLRSIGKNWSYSISGLIVTFFIVFLNVIFLLVLKKGVVGYLYSLLIAQFASSVYIFISCDTWKNFDLKFINIDSLKNMLIYSLPLVPNNIMWWIMNAGDKYVINYYLGNSANGIFSLAYKIPTILTMMFSIFMQAWQVSAIEEREDKSRNDFYKKVFEIISLLLIICTSLIILVVQPMFVHVMGKEFVDAWEFVPLLCIATLFNCYSTFAGIVYIVNQESKKSFYTTSIGAFFNLFFNFLLIKELGLFGVSIGTAIGYAVVMYLRFRDSKRTLRVSFFSFKLLTALIILCVDSVVYIAMESNLKYIISIICIFLIVLIHSKDISVMLHKILKSKLK